MDKAFLNLISLSIPTSALIAVLYLISPLIRRSYAAKWRQYMWLFCALRLLFPIKLERGTVYTVTVAAGGGAAAAAPVGMRLVEILSAVWLAGTVLYLVWQAVVYLKFRRDIRRWRRDVEGAELRTLFVEIKAGMGIKRKIDFAVCKKLCSPMITGFVRPMLLLPTEDYSAEDAEIILNHEMIHFKKLHLYYKLIMLLANAVNWFNPFAYLMCAAANKDLELACDDEVISGSGEAYREKYCRAIISSIHKGAKNRALTTCFSFNKRLIKDRFANILSTRKKKNGLLICCAVAMSLVLCTTLIGFAEEKVAPVVEEALNYVPPVTATPAPESTAEPEPTAAPIAAAKSDREISNTKPTETAAPAPVSVPVTETQVTETQVIETPATEAPTAEPQPTETVTAQPYENYDSVYDYHGSIDHSIDESSAVSANINIAGSQSFDGEDLDAPKTVTVQAEKDMELDSGDGSYTAYIYVNGNSEYEMIYREK